MTYLLDVNALLSGVWSNHPLHRRTVEGIEGKSLVVCPLAELGFIRISTDPSAGIRSGMEDARAALQKFLEGRKVQRINDDLPALESHPKTSKQVTDHYLAALAGKHGFKLATLDERIKHPAVVLL
jgi:predicted nucleic acid-binding protein